MFPSVDRERLTSAKLFMAILCTLGIFPRNLLTGSGQTNTVFKFRFAEVVVVIFIFNENIINGRPDKV